MTDEQILRDTLALDGQEISYLHAGDGTPVLLLHGTFWSRVWLPVIPGLAESHAVYALDYPGFGRPGGRLEAEDATAPVLASLVLRVVDALGIRGSFAVAGHGIGGAVAQRVAVEARDRVSRLALVNSVLYDSWPVPVLEQFRDDPEYARNIAPGSWSSNGARPWARPPRGGSPKPRRRTTSRPSAPRAAPAPGRRWRGRRMLATPYS